MALPTYRLLPLPAPRPGHRWAAEWACLHESVAQIEVRVRPWDVVRQWLRELSAVMGAAPRSLEHVANAAYGLFVLSSLRAGLMALADVLVGAFA